jgi:hypothetical protein
MEPSAIEVGMNVKTDFDYWLADKIWKVQKKRDKQRCESGTLVTIECQTGKIVEIDAHWLEKY